ncbi:putative membrane protein [Lactiplantibacillus pentosus KCA1]|nr:YfhO family protein [Lactiplantibacillus pentosus]EIW13763.1 putative membrane protein [Lactiplantibacillus pentosus KCA1]
MLKKMKRVPLWLWYSVLFAIVISVVYGSLFQSGRSLVWRVDGITQHLPILIEFQRMLKGVGNQSLFGWSWNLGLGADQMTTFSYYVVGDPFNYLIKFFPVSHVEQGYQILILLRFYTIGLAFLLFSSIWNFSRFSRLVGALTYTLTAYTFLVGMHHPFFLLPMILFPLLCWGIERIFREQHWWPLAVIVALTALSNIYFMYLLGIGCLIFTGWRYWQLSVRAKKILPFQKLFRQLVVPVVIGILIAGTVLVPTALLMSHSARTGSQFASGMLLYPLSYYLALPNLLITNGSGLPYWTLLGMSGITFFGIVHSLRHFKQHFEVNVLIIAIGLSVLFPAIAAVFNVMTSPSNRWLLMTTLLFAFLTMRLIDELPSLDKVDYLSFIGASVGLLVLVWLSGGLYLNISRHDAETYVLLFLLLVWLICCYAFALSSTISKSGLLLIVCLNLMNNGLGWTSMRQSTQSQNQLLRGSASSWIKNYLDGAERSIGDTGSFSRVSLSSGYSGGTQTPGNNIPMLMGIHNIASYFSIQNHVVNDYSKSIGNSVSVVNSPLGNVDERLSANNFLGVRYVFMRADHFKKDTLPSGYSVIQTANGKPKIYRDIAVASQLSNGTGTVVLENYRAFPLLYTQNKQITPVAYNKMSQVKREQAMIFGTVLEKRMPGIVVTKLPKNTHIASYKVQADTSKLTSSMQQVVTKRQQAGEPSVLSSNAKHVLKQNQQISQSIKHSNTDGLQVMENGVDGSVTTYKLALDHPERFRGKSLYLDLSGIRATYSSDLSINQLLLANTPIYMNQVMQQSAPAIFNNGTQGYSFKATTHTFSTGFDQQANSNLSNYVIRKHVLLNLGYARSTRKTITLRIQGATKINFKRVRVLAVSYGERYKQQIKHVQQQKLHNLKITNNRIIGNTQNTTASVLTSSIPYSKGWHLTVDGKTQPIVKVNKGFVGAKVLAGRHRIVLTYRTPGLILGIVMSIIGTGILLLTIFVQAHKKNVHTGAH